MEKIIDAEITSETPVSSGSSEGLISLTTKKKPKMEILKPDVIEEAISVELKLIESIEKEIESLKEKIKSKQAKIKNVRSTISHLQKAKQAKTGQ